MQHSQPVSNPPARRPAPLVGLGIIALLAAVPHLALADAAYPAALQLSSGNADNRSLLGDERSPSFISIDLPAFKHRAPARVADEREAEIRALDERLESAVVALSTLHEK